MQPDGVYPHNLVLEAFMATGIAGGIAYLVLICFMLLACFRLLSRSKGYEWLALIAIYYLVAAQFSGSHWSFNAHWQTLVLVIVTDMATRGEAHTISGESEGRKRRRRRH